MAARIDAIMKEEKKSFEPVDVIDNRSTFNSSNFTFSGRFISLVTQRGGICISY